jgi:hypothetical protein
MKGQEVYMARLARSGFQPDFDYSTLDVAIFEPNRPTSP